jgi:xanthine dehydrogenase YagR molybdenum-binding subunit
MSHEERYWEDEAREPQAPASEPAPQQPAGPALPPPWTETRVVGKPLQRIDAYDRVGGSAVFSSDVMLKDMLYGATLRCPHAHAHVKKIDVSAAEKMPGVHAIITDQTPGADIPWYGGRGGSLSRLFDPHCRFEGEEVAAVAAETPYQAWDAVRAIKVEYEVLPSVSTEEDALKPNAPVLHGKSNKIGDAPTVYERGNVQAGFAAADVVRERTYTTAAQIHNPMESFGCVAKWDGGNYLTIWDTTQGVFPVQQAVAQNLKLPLSNVRVIGHYMGGGFGAKLSASKYHIITALLAKRTGRPVKLFITREEAMLAVGNRPPVKMTVKAGVKKDGTLTALQMTVVGTGGAYSGAGSVDFQVRDLYLCPNVRTEAQDVYINAGPQRAFRAPGHPQGNWALEQMMDELAQAIGIDPVEFRAKNVPTVSQASNNTPYSTTGLKECLIEGAKAFGWQEARKKGPGTGPIRRGVGMAAGLWSGGSGGPPSTAIVRLFADGSVNLNMGASDIGTGTKTVMAQVVAEELGVPLERIRVEHADTGTTQYASASGGSKTVPTESPAVRNAALDVKRQVLEMAAEQMKLPIADLSLVDGQVVAKSDPTKKQPVSGLNGFRARNVIVGVGYREPNPRDRVTRTFAAQFAEVEVNMRTGEVKILRYLAAQDSGRVLNAKTFANQTFGGVIMGIGFGVTEGRVLDRHQTGKMVNANLHDYKLPTAFDVPPDPVCLPIDLHDTFNNTGAKGLGEPCTVPAASTIANAICHAIGVRCVDTPISPSRICALVAQTAKRG